VKVAALHPEHSAAPDFLPTLTEAPDFTTAASFVVEQLVGEASAERGYLMVLDVGEETLRLAAQNGTFVSAPGATIPISELSNPVVTVALSLASAWLPTPASLRANGGPVHWLALPLPQPYVRGAPPVLAEHHAAELLTAAGAEMLATARRLGQSPAGVMVLDVASLDPGRLSRLAHLAALSGPVLSRLAELDSQRVEIESLRHRSERLMLMMDALPDPVVITDAASDMLVQNSRAEHLLATRESDSAGRRRALEINNLLFTSGLARAVMSGTQQAGAPRELNLVDPDEGADLLFEMLARPLKGEGVTGGAVLSVLRDVTDLRRAADELERQVQRVRQAEVKARGERDRLNLILENVADPILVTDLQAKIILMNDEAEQLFEVDDTTSGQYAFQGMQAVLANDTKFTTFITEFSLSADSSRRERIALTRPADGTEVPVEVVSGKIRSERGEPVAIVSVMHDLTKQVENERLYRELKVLADELEGRVRAATADLEEQNERLKWQSQELERANKLKDDFLASMSHELRTPINAIIGHSSLLLDRIYGEVNARQNDALGRIRSAAQDLLLLINDILDLARIEAGKMPLNIDSVDVRTIIAELTQQLEPIAQRRGLTLTSRVPSDCPLLETDRQRVKQILLNLLSNAVKFTHTGGITIVVACEPESMEIAVEDTGIGIKPEDMYVVWEDFRQVDQSKTREVGGTGLGLSIVRKLLARLGGAAAVHSTYGVGSRFAIRLPLRFARELEDERAADIYRT